MYVIPGYPQISKTYLKTELEALYKDYNITIVSRKPSDVPYKNHFPYHHLTEKDAIKEYVGEAGFVYDSIEEVVDIIKKPVPEDLRVAGFLQAKKSDIQQHKHLLTDLWHQAA